MLFGRIGCWNCWLRSFAALRMTTFCRELNFRLVRCLTTYSEIIPIVSSHVSTNWGHAVIGSGVGRSPNACPPSAYRCISTGTPAFFRAM